jgi:pyruvate/2-oxoglutarate dehydrogenase complex dihydrolipoamide acyltransferase (E2) component
MSTVDPTVLQKLQKILSRADTSRGSTEAEAQAAMAAAQRLAIQHNLDLASVMASGPGDAPSKLETDKVTLKAPNKHRPYSEPVAHVLQECFDVSVIWVGRDATAVLVGEKTDVALATYCWGWLQETFPRLFRQYCDANGLPFLTGTVRRSYYVGLSQGIRQNNRRQRAEARADKATGGSFALVLVKKEELVQARVAQEFPMLSQMPHRQRAVDHDALAHGRVEGGKIKLGHGVAAGSGQGRLS